MLDIRTMRGSDIDFAVSMTDHEDWGNVASDFTRLMTLEPGGCFVAWENGERVGMISTTTYNDYAFVGSLIVHPDRRGRGTGESLMRRAMAYLRAKETACVELDATSEGEPLYRRLGFKDKYLSLRFFRPADNRPHLEARLSSGGDSDQTVRVITGIDKRLTGLDRSRLLTRLIREVFESVFMDPSSSPNGYAIVYPRSGNRVNIGPLVAADVSTAERILDMIIRAYASHDIGVGAPETQRTVSQIMTARGFLFRPPSLRMYWGRERRYEAHVYAIVSAEKG